MRQTVEFTYLAGIVRDKAEDHDRLRKGVHFRDDKNDACASSTSAVQPRSSFLGFKCVVRGKLFTVGLAGKEAERGNPDPGTIDFAAHVTLGNRLEVYEHGVFVGSYGTVERNDTLTVLLNPQDQVEYSVNGKIRYTGQSPSSLPLYVKLCAIHCGPVVEKVEWVSWRDASSAAQHALQRMTAEMLQLESALLNSQAENHELRRQIAERALLQVALAQEDLTNLQTDLAKVQAGVEDFFARTVFS